jgi:cbb3-type cytochrome oxidase subunit 3
MLRDFLSRMPLTTYPVFGLLFFFSFFVAAVAWALVRNRDVYAEVEALPLEDERAGERR